LVAAVLLPALALSAETDGKKKTEESKVQATCPVMGGKINKEIFADHEGKRVYFCCRGCVETFKKDPAKYVKKLEDAGVVLDRVCACGEVKGSEACKKARAGKGACKKTPPAGKEAKGGGCCGR
jgi:YHS domain-containing protein